ncbi:MAG: hypothetical protein MK110_06390 [Fuerstiella sp.]|nr:hypothetical protein [Fuerstiella sp.]
MKMFLWIPDCVFAELPAGRLVFCEAHATGFVFTVHDGDWGELSYMAGLYCIAVSQLARCFIHRCCYGCCLKGDDKPFEVYDYRRFNHGF